MKEPRLSLCDIVVCTVYCQDDILGELNFFKQGTIEFGGSCELLTCSRLSVLLLENQFLFNGTLFD